MSRVWLAAILLAASWTAASSLATYPHELAYFNEVAGGPAGGYRHLLGSNLDWGQDLIFAEEALRSSEPQIRQVYLVGPNSRVAKYWSALLSDQPSTESILCSANDLLWEYRASQIPHAWKRIGYTMFRLKSGERDAKK